MRELTGFEGRLATAIDDYAGPRRPIDAIGIARRAAETGGTQPMRPAILGGRSRATDTRSALRLALVAAVAATALIAGGLLVGALTQRQTATPSPAPSLLAPTTSPSTEPSTTANVLDGTFSCAEAQAAAARTTTTWTAGPAPADPATAENGWIAIWGSDAVPELYLIDPATGAPCLLARFPASANPAQATPQGPLGWVPPRGPLVWSPDGQALAFVVVGERTRDLYVWSLAGLAGPLISGHDGLWPGTPSWSPDGSVLASPEQGNTGLNVITSVQLIERSGAPTRAVASGCACHLGQVVWSSSGRSIATTKRYAEGNRDGIVAGAVDATHLQDVPILQDPAMQVISEQVLGFVDEQSLLLVNPSPQRFTARSITGGTNRDLGPTRLMPTMLEQGPLVLAPDRSAWLFGRISSYGVLEIGTGAETLLRGTADGMAAGWAPNSRALGYVDMVQDAGQGVWVVNRDGSGTREVVAGPYVLEDPLSPFAWQPVWPGR
jgi:hypothetical protein